VFGVSVKGGADMNWIWNLIPAPLPAADPDPFAMTTGETIIVALLLAAIVVIVIQWHWIGELKERRLQFDEDAALLRRENERMKRTLKNIGWGDEDGALDLSEVKTDRRVIPLKEIR
jgi:H+/gluconate symporter-like permease